ncbi:hypothetical protein EJB05_44562, partial [Eragrostis curvula]
MWLRAATSLNAPACSLEAVVSQACIHLEDADSLGAVASSLEAVVSTCSLEAVVSRARSPRRRWFTLHVHQKMRYHVAACELLAAATPYM